MTVITVRVTLERPDGSLYAVKGKYTIDGILTCRVRNPERKWISLILDPSKLHPGDPKRPINQRSGKYVSHRVYSIMLMKEKGRV